jgi:hypothetical protein
MAELTDLRERIDDMLAAFGGLYTLDDILQAIDDGEMQSFTDGSTWIVTQIANYPRKRVLEVLIAVGDMASVLKLQPVVVDFAKSNQCDMISTIARLGWEGQMTPGWKRSASVYVRTL